MISLINDELGFKELFSDHTTALKLSNSYLLDYKKDFIEQLKKFLENKDALVADLAIAAVCEKLGLEFTSVLKHFENLEFSKSFKDFNIAVYQGFYSNDLYKLAQASGAKLICFDKERYENGFRYLDFDKTAAYKQAASVVLDAYDSGADFMLVGDVSSMIMFDECANYLQAVSNRDFSDFYILNAAEFIALASGKIPASLKTHKLKVSLV